MPKHRWFILGPRLRVEGKEIALALSRWILLEHIATTVSIAERQNGWECRNNARWKLIK